MSIFNRFWDALGFGVADEPEYEEYLEETPVEGWQQDYSTVRRSGATNVVGLPAWGASPTEVVLVEPRSFEEIPQVVSALKDRKTVVLNLTLMDADAAQRCVDFVAGGVFAMDGHQERVAETVFLFTPNVVQITHQSLEEPQPEAQVLPRRMAIPVRPPAVGETHSIQ